MSEIGQFLKVPVEHLDAFIGHEIYLYADTTGGEGEWELLQEVRKEMLRQLGKIGEPDTMVLHEVAVAVDQTRWSGFSDSPFTARFAPGKFARVRPSQRKS